MAKSDDKTAKVVDLRFTELPTTADQPYTTWQWPFAWNFNLIAQEKTRLKTVRPELPEPVKTLRHLGQRIQGKGGWVAPVE